MGWCWFSWMKVVRDIKWYTVHGRRGNRRLSEEGGDLSLLCLLHILIHLVCYRNDRCLILKFHAALLEMVSHKEMVESPTIWKHSFTVLVFGWGLSIAVSDLWFIEHSRRFTQQHESHYSSGYHPPLHLETFLLNFMGLFHILSFWLVKVQKFFLTVSSPSFYQQPFSFVLDLISGPLYTNCAVGCAVQPSAFNDTNTFSITLTPKMLWKVWQV